MFEKGSFVYYTSGGVCSVFDVCYAPIKGMPSDRLYYILYPLNDASSRMYVPVENGETAMRRLLSAEEAEALIQSVPEITELSAPDAKSLRQIYIDAMKKHDPTEWVRVIKTVHRRLHRGSARASRISETERSYSEDSKRFLFSELSVALGKRPDEMANLILSMLPKLD